MLTTILAMLLTVLVVCLLLGVCIFVHEFGHLLAALACGLHVERFSLGFGRRLWGWHVRGVEYVISLLPFGGYVALPQLEPTDKPVDRNGTPLPVAKPWQRMLTALAGPLANIAFGFALALIVCWVSTYRPAPMDRYVVHSVEDGCPEQAAGLRPDDAIVKVNGAAAPDSWQATVEKIVLSTGDLTLGLERAGTALDITYRPARNPAFEGLAVPFFQVRMPVVAEQVIEGMPAAAAGVRPGDRFLAVNGRPVLDALDFVEAIAAGKGQALDLLIERDGQPVTLTGIVPVEREMEGETRAVIGVRPGEPMILAHVGPWRQFVNVLTMNRSTLRAVVSRSSSVGARHMSGPLGILQVMYRMIRYEGWRRGLSFVVLVTFSLAVLNLLPVPVLDGGHILFGFIETVIRRRIPHRLSYVLQTAFAGLLIAFILYVTYWDANRAVRPWLKKDKPAAEAPAATPQPEPAP